MEPLEKAGANPTLVTVAVAAVAAATVVVVEVVAALQVRVYRQEKEVLPEKSNYAPTGCKI